MFGANLMIPAQICAELLHTEPEFPRIQSKNGQNELESHG